MCLAQGPKRNDAVESRARGPSEVRISQMAAERSLSVKPTPILALSHTFMDHDIISTVFLLLPLIQEGLLSITSESMCNIIELIESVSFHVPIKRNDWLLADMCPQAANHCALF